MSELEPTMSIDRELTFARKAVHTLCWLLPGALLALVMLLPFVMLIGQSTGYTLTDWSAYRTVVASQAWWNAVLTSLRISGISTACAAALGVPVALTLHLVAFRGSRLLVRFIELMAAFPSFVIAFALIFLYGTRGTFNVALQEAFGLSKPPFDFLYGPGGVILALTTYYLPFMIRPTLAVLELLDPALSQAAQSLGASPLKVLRRVVVPLALPGIAAGAVLIFLLIQSEFGILLVLGSQKVPTMPMLIYNTAMINLDLNTAAVQALFMLGVAIAVFSLYRGLSARALRAARLSSVGKSVPGTDSPFQVRGHSGRWLLAAVSAFVGLLFVLPILVVIASAFAKRWIATLLPDGWTMHWFAALDAVDYASIANSVTVALAAAFAATVCGTALAILVRRMKGAVAAALDFAMMLPTAVPSVVIGLAVLMAYHRAPLDLSGSPLIVALVQFLLALPFAYRALAAASDKLPWELDEAAAGLGASAASRLRRVVLPLLAPGLRASFAMTFALSMGELGATIMVYPAGFVTAPVSIIQDVGRGYYYQGSALAMLSLASAFGGLLLIASVRLPFRTRGSGRIGR